MSSHSSRAHALLSASKADRWLNCTPSARLEETVEESRKSSYAAEGELAHELAEIRLRYLLGEITARGLNHEVKRVHAHPLFADDMEEAVSVYITYIQELLAEARSHGSIQVLVEERSDFSHIVPHGFGTTDFGLIGEKTLYIVDYKHGKGIKVDAKLNPQLMLYAKGLIQRYNLSYAFDRVRMVVVQPRIDNISEWETTVNYVESWAHKIAKPKADLAYVGEGEKQVGDWCRFCKVSALCKALADHNLALARFEFSDPDKLTIGELVPIFEQIPALVQWANSVGDYLLDSSLKGVVIPGYKPVEGRSQRRWISEEKALAALRKLGYPDDQITQTKIAGIGTIESLVGKKDFPSLLGGVVEKPQGKPTLAPVTDKRPSLVGVEQAKKDFE